MAQKNILDLKVETSTKQNPQDARDPQNEYGLSVPPPHNEPIVGVIDTRFDETAYFADWVEYHDDLIDPQLGVIRKTMRMARKSIPSLWTALP